MLVWATSCVSLLGGVTSRTFAAESTPGLMMGDAGVEEGKALYENGQYLAALSKFMTVLRRDPHQPEARRYLSMVVDILRASPGKATPGRPGTNLVGSIQSQEELRQLLNRRSLLTLDLKAIPGVKVNFIESVGQVEIDSSMLFAPGGGALQEQAIPVLDRVSAWIKTFGAQPIIIHCYPEELQDPATNGSLFLSRYSELYNFFVEERKLDPKRFISADLLAPEPNARGGSSSSSSATSVLAVEVSTSTPRVVIETMGSQTAMLAGMPNAVPRHALSRWLEISVESSRSIFNPEEGEWANIDIAALSRISLRNWIFKIASVENPRDVVFSIEGKTNVLKRIAWDGHHAVTGSFVPSGLYECKLTATDDEGKIMTRQVKIQITRTTETPVVVSAPKETKKSPVTKKAKKKKPEARTEEVSESVPTPVAKVPVATPAAAKSSVAASAVDDSNTLIDPAATASAQAATASDSGEPGDSARAIWKQVIQFEPGEAEIKPTLKASLERISKTLEVYPLQKVRILGFAMNSEPGAAALAQKRADAVRSVLVDQYRVDRKRVIMAGGKTTNAPSSSKVEMSISD